MSVLSRAKASAARPAQADLFGEAAAAPEGFGYQPGIIDVDEEDELAAHLAALPFEPFDFHGYLANRQVVGFGLRYDYASRQVKAAPAMPGWLEPLRERVGAFAGRPAEAFVQVLINKYEPGAGIGWHRDKPHFDAVVGVSLQAPCRFRFRRKAADIWERRSVIVEPRSAYLLSGPARDVWEHSIAPLDRERCSITFRTLRA
jgi:alkylated DNA repair dioxygenase AlkB